MASDTFDISADQIAAVNSQLETMNSNIEGINRSSSLTATMMAQIPDAMKDAGNTFKDVINSIKEVQQNTERTAKEADTLNTNLQKVVKELDNAEKASEKTSKHLSACAERVKSAAGGVAKWALGLAGIALGVKGIADKLLEYANNYRKISGYGMIINAQFERSNTKLQSMASFANNLRFSFYTSVEEAGEFVKQLSRAGMEQANIIKYGREIYAIEQLNLGSAKDQIASLQNLVGNYQMIEESAMNYNSLMRQIAKRTPDLSFDAALSDIKEVNENQKMWNSNLLTSTSLYEVLTTKNLAKTLGMDKMPVDLRRAMSKGISGINKDMSMEWKAAIAMSMDAFKGKSPAAAILGFEDLATKKGGLATQFKGVMDFVGKHSGINKGLITPESIIKARQLLSQINIPGMSPEIVQKIVANMTPGKAFSTENLAKLIEKSIAQETALAAEEKNQTTERNKNIKEALGAVNSMTDYQKKMANYFEQKATPLAELTTRFINLGIEFFDKGMDYFALSMEKLKKELGVLVTSRGGVMLSSFQETAEEEQREQIILPGGKRQVAADYANRIMAAQLGSRQFGKDTNFLDLHKKVSEAGIKLVGSEVGDPARVSSYAGKSGSDIRSNRGIELGLQYLTRMASQTGDSDTKAVASDAIKSISEILASDTAPSSKSEETLKEMMRTFRIIAAKRNVKLNTPPAGNTINEAK